MPRKHTYVIADGGPCPGSELYRPWGVRIYETTQQATPSALQGREPQPHTWAAHLQRRLNDEPYTALPARIGPPALRDYQQPRVNEIIAASDTGAPGYLLGYPTGTGKTYITVAAMNQINPRRVLVIAPLSHLANWRRVITDHATGRTEWVVINPARLHTLFRLPAEDPRELVDLPQDTRATHAISHGHPITDFDVVVTDEAQILANPTSQRSQLWRRLAGWNDDGSAPDAFTLNLSATAFSLPRETAAVAHLLAFVRGQATPSETLLSLDYEHWLRDRMGVDLIQHTRGLWSFRDSIAGVKALTEMLYQCGIGATATRADLGLPEQPLNLQLIQMDTADRALYETSWREYNIATGRPVSDVAEPEAGREEGLRHLQKAAEVKARYVAELIVDYIEEGYQVIVPAWLRRTVDALHSHVDHIAQSRQLPVPESGRWSLTLDGTATPEERDVTIRLFQAGWTKVLITSTTEAVSLHAGQKGGGFDGADATDAPRVTIFGDVLSGGKRIPQAVGRGSRDGNVAEAIFAVAEDTREVPAWARAFTHVGNTGALTSDPGLLLSDAEITAYLQLADDLTDLMEDAQ